MPHKFRVITPFGFGRMDDFEKGGSVEIVLESDPQKVVALKKDDVFLFSSLGVVKILDLTPRGGKISAWESGFYFNIHFTDSLNEAREQIFANTPKNELRLLVNLGFGEIESSRPLREIGIFSGPVAEISPRIDLWEEGRIKFFDSISSAVKAEESAKNEGFYASILMDVKSKKIIRFSLFIPSGIIFEKKY